MVIAKSIHYKNKFSPVQLAGNLWGHTLGLYMLSHTTFHLMDLVSTDDACLNELFCQRLLYNDFSNLKFPLYFVLGVGDISAKVLLHKITNFKFTS